MQENPHRCGTPHVFRVRRLRCLPIRLSLADRQSFSVRVVVSARSVRRNSAVALFQLGGHLLPSWTPGVDFGESKTGVTMVKKTSQTSHSSSHQTAASSAFSSNLRLTRLTECRKFRPHFSSARADRLSARQRGAVLRSPHRRSPTDVNVCVLSRSVRSASK